MTSLSLHALMVLYMYGKWKQVSEISISDVFFDILNAVSQNPHYIRKGEFDIIMFCYAILLFL